MQFERIHVSLRGACGAEQPLLSWFARPADLFSILVFAVRNGGLTYRRIGVGAYGGGKR